MTPQTDITPEELAAILADVPKMKERKAILNRSLRDQKINIAEIQNVLMDESRLLLALDALQKECERLKREHFETLLTALDIEFEPWMEQIRSAGRITEEDLKIIIGRKEIGK